jgi:uncharacterized RDD family membrane protein YckC
MEYASFSRRAVALLIDGILLSFVSYLFSGSGFDWAGPSWGMSALPMIIGWLYFAGMESSSRRATLGKRVMEMQVVTEENDQLSFVQASIRYFSKILSALILFIGYFMMLFSDRKQTLHDQIAKTMVVKA